MHFLRKAEEVLQHHLGAIVQHGGAAHAAKHLVLVGADQLHIQQRRPVDNGHKVHLKPTVRGSELPGICVIIADQEGYIVQLMPHPVVEQNILRGGGGVTKAVTDIKAKAMTVNITRA